jgi:adenosylcobinamide-GDP ribazoletransferase
MRPAPRPGPRPGPRPAARLAAVVDPILAALMLLTRLPVRVARPMAPAAFARAYGWFPAVGALVGAVGGLVLWGAGGAVPPLAAALLAVAAQVLLTGGLHEDGLADVADGFGGGRDRERRLAIMRDSRIGTYGALALVLGVGLRVALLAPLAGTAEAVWTLAAVGALSRAPLGTMARAMPPARTDGLAVSQGRPSGLVALAAAALGIAIAAACVPGWPGAAAGAAAGAGAVALLALRRIGGVTGDVHGAAQQVAAVGALVGLGVVTPAP